MPQTRGETWLRLLLYPYLIVFACKFDGHQKVRLVEKGSCTLVDLEEVYAGVVGMETSVWASYLQK